MLTRKNGVEPDVSGKREVHRAALAGDVERTFALLAEESSVDCPAGPVRDDKVLSHEGASPLHFAALGGHVELCERLLDRGAKLDGRDLRGQTPLHYGVRHAEVIEFLVRRGAPLDVTDADGTSALIAAVRSGVSSGAHELLARGADPNLADDRGITALMSAAIRNDPDLVRALIHHGAEPGAICSLGHDAIWWAKYNDHEEVANLIASAEPDGETLKSE